VIATVTFTNFKTLEKFPLGSSGFGILKPCLGIYNPFKKGGLKILQHYLGIANSEVLEVCCE
jgi:hypothetical protein